MSVAINTPGELFPQVTVRENPIIRRLVEVQHKRPELNVSELLSKGFYFCSCCDSVTEPEEISGRLKCGQCGHFGGVSYHAKPF
jgi:hypothetical protein